MNSKLFICFALSTLLVCNVYGRPSEGKLSNQLDAADKTIMQQLEEVVPEMVLLFVASMKEQIKADMKAEMKPNEDKSQ
ncbi:hypothetical protein HHI36_017877 [Cryptolaemus montrouzieri]|uniref:Uncharacterized protein n=1 Tax=Cryptolaemus montrouzieri TaxID=559131 RepID=A0ABD2NPN3_9CUCU